MMSKEMLSKKLLELELEIKKIREELDKREEMFGEDKPAKSTLLGKYSAIKCDISEDELFEVKKIWSKHIDKVMKEIG